MDFGLGRYEVKAAQLEPAAREAVRQLAPRSGERLLDLGCGTGNAALIAAEQGAAVTGVDPAPRLLDVARARASAVGLDIDFRIGDAAGIPLPDHSVDAVI